MTDPIKDTPDNSDDLIVGLLGNKANWKKLKLELANTYCYRLESWDIEQMMKESWRWN